MNVLVVSSYPPMACGIGNYAAQQVAALRAEGHRVDVLSPPEGDGDFQETLLGGWRPLRLLHYAWAYDELLIHFTPHFFYDPQSRWSRLATSLAFLAVSLGAPRRLSFQIHETSFRVGQARRGLLRDRFDRWTFRLARRLLFHSTRERDSFVRFYRLRPDAKNIELTPHERHMVRRCALDRDGARRALGIDPARPLFLCIGFIQPHKGFERAIAAMRAVASDRPMLKIVGSVRLYWDVAHAYARALHEAAQQDPRCEVIESYLSDEMFDTWLAAADYVVIPYREIWSSSVAARAKLYDRPMLVADAGGLVEQITPGSRVFADEAALAAMIDEIAVAWPEKSEIRNNSKSNS